MAAAAPPPARPVAGMALTCTQTYVAASDGAAMEGKTFDLISRLGSGSFGEVWWCRDRSDGQQRAVKLLFDASNMVEVRRECHFTRRAVQAARSHRIPDFCGLAEAELTTLGGDVVRQLPVICTELIDGGSLSDIVPHMRGEEDCIRQVVEDIGCALQHLHRAGIVHLDIKPANVLVDRSGNSYLCDFGISIYLPQFAGQPNMPVKGTPFYMAPEMLQTRPCVYDAKVDVWALGVVAYELQVGRVPLMRPGQTYVPRPQFLLEILSTLDHVNLDAVSDASESFQSFLQECLHVDPSRRLSSAKVLQHPFICCFCEGVRDRTARMAIASMLLRLGGGDAAPAPAL